MHGTNGIEKTKKFTIVSNKFLQERYMAKLLEKNSKYNRYDMDGNGTVDDGEINNANEILEIELREEKADAHRRMAWVAMISMIIFSGFLFLPIIEVERVKALADLLGMFYIAQAGVVGAYMGVTAWMSRK